jgi:hypothetical protein
MTTKTATARNVIPDAERSQVPSGPRGGAELAAEPVPPSDGDPELPAATASAPKPPGAAGPPVRPTSNRPASWTRDSRVPASWNGAFQRWRNCAAASTIGLGPEEARCRSRRRNATDARRRSSSAHPVSTWSSVRSSSSAMRREATPSRRPTASLSAATSTTGSNGIPRARIAWARVSARRASANGPESGTSSLKCTPTSEGGPRPCGPSPNSRPGGSLRRCRGRTPSRAPRRRPGSLAPPGRRPGR